MSTPHWLITDEADLDALTPVMRQVVEQKRRHPDTLLFVRLGDFYELFFEDALLAAPLMDMVLTSRNKNDARPIPMCGFPYHAMAGYVQKALDEGLRVAVCEQLQDPRLVKGLVERGVTRVITPGVVLEAEALDGRRSNNLLSLVPGTGGAVGLAVADVSTGDFRVAEVRHATALDVLLVRLEPREILLPEALRALVEGLPAARGLLRTVREVEAPLRREHRGAPAQLAAAQVRAYLAEVRPSTLGLLAEPQQLEIDTHLSLGREAVQHLEILYTARQGRRQGSLMAAVDRTGSVAGSRLLRGLLLAPLADREAITDRLGAVQAWVEQPGLRVQARALLAGSCDLARVVGRAVGRMVTPRELASARETLERLPELQQTLASLTPCVEIERLSRALEGAGALTTELRQALRDEPRNQVSDGEVIRQGWCPELDELVCLCQDARGWVDRYEQQLRAETSNLRLKLKYNRVTGYGIEISRTRADEVPASWRRVQTLKHVERYTTAELQEFERRLSRAEDDRLARETALYDALVASVASNSDLIRRVAAAMADLDVHTAFAELAAEQDLVRPEMTDEVCIDLQASRHPVIEQLLPAGAFVPNDIQLSAQDARILLLTGPNMAGKSTLMRQVALASVLAQAGSFVPAAQARLPVLDAIMTRIGASDDISEGASTFMIEMRETAAILQHATPRTLVLLDEIGRGTSTWDGLSIAWAVIEALHDRGGAMCLFATHYHELTALSDRLAHLRNAHVAVREWGDEVVFVHRLQDGPTSRSHGITVARLAGLPEACISRAREVLAELEARARRSADAPADPGGRARQLSFFDAPPSPAKARMDPEIEAIVQALGGLDTDDLSPRAAHAWLTSVATRAADLLRRREGAGG